MLQTSPAKSKVKIESPAATSFVNAEENLALADVPNHEQVEVTREEEGHPESDVEVENAFRDTDNPDVQHVGAVGGSFAWRCRR